MVPKLYLVIQVHPIWFRLMIFSSFQFQNFTWLALECKSGKQKTAFCGWSLILYLSNLWVYFCISIEINTLGSCDRSSATKAFLFSFNNIKGYNPVKLTQYRNQRYAMYRCSSYGPTFGWRGDIHIREAVNNQYSFTKCGGTYANPTGYSAGDCGFFTGSYHFTPSDIEVFFEIGKLLYRNT